MIFGFYAAVKVMKVVRVKGAGKTPTRRLLNVGACKSCVRVGAGRPPHGHGWRVGALDWLGETVAATSVHDHP